MICKYFLPLNRWPFHFAGGFLRCSAAFYFDVVPLFDFCFCWFLLLVSNQKNKSLRQYQWACFLLVVLCFQVYSQAFNPLWVNFCKWYKIQFNFILLNMVVLFSQHHLLKRLSFPHWIFLALLSNVSWSYMYRFISGLSVLFYWSMSLFFCRFCNDYYWFAV